MRLIVILALALPLWGQLARERFVVIPTPADAVGTLEFREQRANGAHAVKVSAPDSLAADLTFRLPDVDGSANWCLTTDGSGVLAFAACAAGSAPPFDDDNPLVRDETDTTKELRFDVTGFTTATVRVVTVPDADFMLAGVGLNNGFSVDQDFLSGRINIGASGATGPGLRDNAGVLECSDDGSTWAACGPSGLSNFWSRTGTVLSTATPNDDVELDRHLLFTSPSVSDIGDATNYAQTLYVENINASPAGVTGNYVTVRKLEITDSVGGVNFWDFQVRQAGAVASYYNIRDNGGTVVHRLVPVEAGGTTINEAQFMFHLVPGNNSTNADNTYDVGTPTRSWRNGQFDGTLTTNNLTVTGTCTGCASLPFLDTSALIKGSSDATKLLRFEVDGFTTAATRVMTPPNADATLAGINLAQTWTATQTFQHIQFPSASAYDIGTSTNYGQTLYIENVDAAPSSVTGNYTKVRKLEIADASGGTNFWDVQVNQQGAVSSNLLVRDNAGTNVFRLVQIESVSTINQAQFLFHVVPGNNVTNADNTYDLGSTARSWRTLYADTSIVINGATFTDASRNTTVNNLTVAGTCTGCGSGGYGTIQEEGVSLTARNTLNFVGAAITAADGGTKTTVTLSQSPASASVVGTGRAINTTSPITGGGDLSADRTIACSDCATLSTTQTFTGQKTFTAAAFFTNTVQVSSTLGTANILPLANNTYDLGASFSNTWRTIYFSTSLVKSGFTHIDSSGNLISAGNVQASTYFSQSGTIRIDVSGRGIFTNANVTSSLIATPASGYTFYVNGSQVRVRFADGTDKEVSLL